MADEPKSRIIIDEDWKTQVEREKEELERKQSQPATAQPSAEGRGPLPPATFEVLLSALATEAMLYLGQIPHPSTGKPVLDLEQARHLIDTIGMLEEKTRGNLAADEQQMLHVVLHDLRLGFLAIEQAAAQPQA